MSDELNDTTPLGKSVEEVEGEPQRQHPDNRGLLGHVLNPDTSQTRDSTDAPTGLLGVLGNSLGMNDDGSSRSRDADKDSSEES